MLKHFAAIGLGAIVLAWTAPVAWSQDAVLRSFAGGDGRTSVGVLDAGEDTGEPEGPQAIYAGDNGELYLLDQINARILKFDSRDPGAPPQTLELPDGVTPTDLVVANGDIHIWDGRVLTLQATGRPDAPTRGALDHTLLRAAGRVDDLGFCGHGLD